MSLSTARSAVWQLALVVLCSGVLSGRSALAQGADTAPADAVPTATVSQSEAVAAAAIAPSPVVATRVDPAWGRNEPTNLRLTTSWGVHAPGVHGPGLSVRSQGGLVPFVYLEASATLALGNEELQLPWYAPVRGRAGLVVGLDGTTRLEAPAVVAEPHPVRLPVRTTLALVAGAEHRFGDGAEFVSAGVVLERETNVRYRTGLLSRDRLHRRTEVSAEATYARGRAEGAGFLVGGARHFDWFTLRGEFGMNFSDRSGYSLLGDGTRASFAVAIPFDFAL